MRSPFGCSSSDDLMLAAVVASAPAYPEIVILSFSSAPVEELSADIVAFLPSLPSLPGAPSLPGSPLAPLSEGVVAAIPEGTSKYQ